MNIRNCRNCGRIFNYVTGAILCQSCKEQMEKKFQDVKEYIRENPRVGIQEVADACEVPTSQIHQWLREERLEVTEDSSIFLNCEGCGAPIRSGKYCDKCKISMTQGFRNVIRESRQPEPQPKTPEKDGPKMRFL